MPETKPDFVLVDAKEFPWLDLNFYDNATVEFQMEGFSPIGDIEFVCFNDISPKCFHRTLSSSDGTIIAEIWHSRERGFKFLLRLLFGALPYKTICLTTELSDGSIIYTISGKKNKQAIPLPAGITKQVVTPNTPIRDMLEIHKGTIKEYNKQHPDSSAFVIQTFDEWAESQYRAKNYPSKPPETASAG